MARKKAVNPVPSMTIDDKSWRARDDLRTLTSAAEISHDNARLRAARAEAKRQMNSLEKVAGAAKRKPKSRRARLENVQL